MLSSNLILSRHSMRGVVYDSFSGWHKYYPFGYRQSVDEDKMDMKIYMDHRDTTDAGILNQEV